MSTMLRKDIIFITNQLLMQCLLNMRLIRLIPLLNRDNDQIFNQCSLDFALSRIYPDKKINSIMRTLSMNTDTISTQLLIMTVNNLLTVRQYQ